jgi:hypothetical protein
MSVMPEPAQADLTPAPAATPASPLDVVRAFAVILAVPILIGGVVIAAIARLAGAAVRRRRPPASAVMTGVALAAYAWRVRPWMLAWGSTPDERARTLPGDELAPGVPGRSTRAVTIEAPAASVWPWVAQLGQDRGGFYSYSWLENLAGCRMTNADRIHPEWQHRAVGDTVLLHPANGLKVTRFEPGRVLALEGWGAFVVEPDGSGRTRLLTRAHSQRGLAQRVMTLLIEVPHFVMERRMLLGIKERAERAIPNR